MQSPQHSISSSHINLTDPTITFVLGLIVGSLIGTTGIIVFGSLITGYYYHENIIAFINDLKTSPQKSWNAGITDTLTGYISQKKDF